MQYIKGAAGMIRDQGSVDADGHIGMVGMLNGA